MHPLGCMQHITDHDKMNSDVATIITVCIKQVAHFCPNICNYIHTQTLCVHRFLSTVVPLSTGAQWLLLVLSHSPGHKSHTKEFNA